MNSKNDKARKVKGEAKRPHDDSGKCWCLLGKKLYNMKRKSEAKASWANKSRMIVQWMTSFEKKSRSAQRLDGVLEVW
jgi:hypothetical protein